MVEWSRLTQWVINKIKSEYAEDIALLIAVDGHSTNGDGHGECFDYFIPAADRGNELSQTFIIEGVGHDLYSRSWERTERTAQLEEAPARCLTGARILYARSEEDKQHFIALQKRLRDNLANPSFIYRKSLEKLDEAMDIYRTLMFEEQLFRARMAVGYIQTYLTQAVAFVNGVAANHGVFTQNQAFHTAPESRMYHCPELRHYPDDFFVYGEQMLEAEDVEELKHLAYLQIHSCRKFLLRFRPAVKRDNDSVNYLELANWYQELSLTWRRIRYFCDHNMAEEAYVDACYLQRELMAAAEEFKLKDMDLLGAFDVRNLETLKERNNELEEWILELLKKHGAKVRAYTSLDEFLEKN